MNEKFSVDIKDFLTVIQNGNKPEIKKNYLSLVKKYHPDLVGNELKSTYNDYLILINRIYTQGKLEIKEAPVEIQDEEEQNQKIYKFTSYYNTEYTFTDYYKYLYEKGKNEWDWATCMLGSGGQNMANDPKSLSDHTSEVMGHLYTGIICLKEVMKHAKKVNDLILVTTCDDLIQRIYKTNNNISRSIIQSEEKSILR